MMQERRPTLGDYVELGMARVMRHLPVTWSSAIGSYLGARYARGGIAKRRRWVQRMHDGFVRFSQIADPVEREQRIVEFFRRVGRIYGEYTVLQRLVEQDRVEVVGREHLAGLSGPTIIVSGHLSNWELVGHVMHMLGDAGTALYDSPESPVRHRLVMEARKRWCKAADLVPASPAAMVRIQKAVARGRNLLMYIDEERDGYIWAPGLGRDIAYAGNRWYVARLAARHGANIVPVHVEFVGPARYRIVIEPRLERVGEDEQSKARSLADQMNSRLENWIRARPEEWYYLPAFEFDLPAPEQKPARE